ncbi:MAG: SDR family oxidoreductase [Cyanobacteria bacterium]|nr:SDR family oxidoreductase [Cyanobacteriota bacterium]MDA1246906.1 SDR family oxidoreductase [Cyanobacteriota bacterium]
MSSFLVTGANRGIGLEYCRQLHTRGDQVIAVCRTASPELEDIGVRLEAGIELTAEADLDDLLQRLSGQPLDAVILNAGILENNRLENFDSESLLRQFEVNALAPLRLVAALLPNLQSGSKLALMTSRMGSIDDNSSGSSYGYRMSKVALNMAGRSLAIDLRPREIAVALLHPGLVRTRMINFNPLGVSTEEAVRGLIERIDALSMETSGSFWHANGTLLPW